VLGLLSLDLMLAIGWGKSRVGDQGILRDNRV